MVLTSSVSTTADKRKKKVAESISKRVQVDSNDSSRYLSKNHKQRFLKVTSTWSICKKRQVELGDFPHSELFHLIDACGSSQIAEALHKIYPQLVYSFTPTSTQTSTLQSSSTIIRRGLGVNGSCLPTSGICEAVGVHIATDELVVKPKAPINRYTSENAKRYATQARGPAPTTKDQPLEG
ncbi:Uncharacterized protein Adt_41985 [Abeliophyllum distichum]|uniref:Uncharacterized protein n=1 Tax=Abeliophyllum distichum TaxID=126358 RepID=A0ABD1PT70_9LAMI